MRRGITRWSLRRAPAFVAVLLVALLVVGRLVDERRDRAQGQLVDVLHLTDLVHQQDAARWRAAAQDPTTSSAPSSSLAGELSVKERIQYLGRLGLAPAAGKTLTRSLDQLESDLRALALTSGPKGGHVDRVSHDIAAVVTQLDARAEQLHESVGSYDRMIDLGTAVGLLLPGTATTISWATARATRREGKRG